MTARQAKDVTDAATSAATESCERVAKRAKQISEVLTKRDKRAKTHPFLKVEIHDEDSLVESIENVIASATKKEE
jgi:predicted nucleotidyltransferase